MPVDKQYDTSIFLNSKCICDTNQLLSLLTGKEFSFPIDEGIIRQYYYFSSKYAFQNVVDLLEEVCTTDKYDIDCYSFRMYLSALKVIMTRMIKWSIFSMNINSKTILIRRIKKLSNWLDFFYYYQAKENYENVDETEMLTISNKIKIILDNEF